MRLVVIAIRESGTKVAIRLSEADAEGEPASTAREREQAALVASSIAILLSECVELMRGEVH